MNLRQHLEDLISQTLSRTTGQPGCQAAVAPSKSAQFGDYQANGTMALAKKLGRKPRELAEEVVKNLDMGGLAAKVEVAGPGFINIFIAPGFLAEQLRAIGQGRLVAPAAQPQTVLIDYSSPNLAKEMHVGHLRGTIIGDAIARTFEYLGHKLIRHNHFGDWGTQFGMLITYMQDLSADRLLAAELSDLESFYRAAKQRFDAEPAFAEKSA